MNRFRFLPPIGVLAVVGAALLAIFGGDQILDPTISNNPETAIQQGTAQASEGSQLFQRADVLELNPVFRDRPLFIEGRRTPSLEQESAPPEPHIAVEPEIEIADVEESAPAPLLPPEIELAGIEIGATGRFALIRNTQDGSENWMREEERLGEWMLAEISQQAVRFVAGGTEITFKLYPEALP